MKLSNNVISKLIGSLACAVLLAASSFPALADGAELPVSEPLCIYGTLHNDNGQISMTNISGDTSLDQLVLNISEETKILDAVNGFPVSVSDLREGETIYAYISHAMTLSIPPQSHAEMILCQIPQDFGVPSYETVSALAPINEQSFKLTTVRGNEYMIDKATILLPYLTRNLVTVQDLTEGRACLVWSTPADAKIASKAVIFAASSPSKQPSGPASDPALTDKIQLQ